MQYKQIIRIMKFTRKFLGGYVTYDENDSIVNANSFFGYIFKSIFAIIWGTVLGIIMFFVIAFLAYIGFSALVWLGSVLLT